MKRFTIFLILSLLCFFHFSYASGDARLDKVNWEAFSKNLVKGLTFENDGIRQAIMQHIITYSDRLNVNDGVFDLIRIYRNHKNNKYRQMAVVALGKVQNKWALYFLRRNLKFEKDPTIRRQILHSLYLQKQAQLANIESEIENLIAVMEK
jgi:hypothetical protein